MGRMGGEAEVPVLLGILTACKRGSEEYRLAQSALVGLPGDEATAAIVAAMRSAEPAICAALLRILAARDVSAQVDTLIALAGRHKDKDVRVAAIESLKSALDRAHVPALIGLLCGAETSDERRAAEKVLMATWRRVQNAETYVGPIASGLSDAPVEARLTLLRLLGVVGNQAALDIVATATRAPEAAVRETAIRTLCKWKGAGALAPLRAVAQEPRNEKEAILALRGIIELAGSIEPEARAVETLANAMQGVKRPEEKRMVLGQLSSFGSVAALDIAVGCLEDESIQREAVQSCRAIVLALDKSEAGQRKDLLVKLAAHGVDELAGAAAGRLVSLESTAYARINFQPRDSGVPEGCLADTGLLFGDRGNGRSYGWDLQNGETRERGSHDDKRYDTLNHIQKGGTRRWEIAMPNGTYWLRVICGDAGHANQVNHLDIEGRIQKDPDGEDHFDEYELRTTVSDGRLTVAPGPGAKNAKLCFVEIRSLDTR
jgi:HEAT repeat protein